MSSELAPRLCHLVKWADFDGYGFNLHAEKSRSGQFIGKVDSDSPAQLAGLREGDRIVEVNGVNIAQENHRQVVERIKSIAGETRLLVVDPEADRYYKEQKLVVKSTMPNVLFLKTPVPRPLKEPPCYENVAPEGNSAERNGTMESTEQHNGKQNGSSGLPANGTHEKTVANEVEEKFSPPQIIKEKDSPVQKTKEEVHSTSRSSTPLDGGPSSVPDSPRSTKSSNSGASNGPTSLEDGMLNLNMSASEMRQMLANRRKKDPKKEQMDIRQKYEIIQQM